MYTANVSISYMGHWYSWPGKSHIMKCKTWGINPWWSWVPLNLTAAKTNPTCKKVNFSAKLAFWTGCLCDYTTASSTKAGERGKRLCEGEISVSGSSLSWNGSLIRLLQLSLYHTFSVQHCGLPLPFNPAYQSYLVGQTCDLLRGTSGKWGQRAEEWP